jgi:ABC-2 type transport system permease protein
MKAESHAIALSHLPSPGALATLFVLTLRQHLRGRRLLVLALLFALPSALAAIVNLLSHFPPPATEVQFVFVLNFIPHALAPLAALLYATGIIQDEVEEQTLTYLLVRPLPRWAIYVVKLLATLLVISALTAAFTTITVAVIALTRGNPITAELMRQAMMTSVVLALAQFGYCGLFGLLGLITRRSLFIGVFYIFLFEGLLASFDTVLRRMTIMFYFRVLVLRWLNPENGARAWAINLTTAPDAQNCVWTLLSIGMVLTALAATFFAMKEFRMKTPEGV